MTTCRVISLLHNVYFPRHVIRVLSVALTAPKHNENMSNTWENCLSGKQTLTIKKNRILNQCFTKHTAEVLEISY